MARLKQAGRTHAAGLACNEVPSLKGGGMSDQTQTIQTPGHLPPRLASTASLSLSEHLVTVTQQTIVIQSIVDSGENTGPIRISHDSRLCFDCRWVGGGPREIEFQCTFCWHVTVYNCKARHKCAKVKTIGRFANHVPLVNMNYTQLTCLELQTVVNHKQFCDSQNST